MSRTTPTIERRPSHVLGAIRGALTLSAITLNTLFWAAPIYVGIVLKLVWRRPGWRAAVQERLTPLAEAWISCNNAILRLFRITQWEIRGLEGLRRDGRYLVNANHQSWADVLVLQRTLNGVVPFLKFFIKQELIWVPVLGLAWWGLDFPFMKRYSSELLEKHPELRGKDLETTAAMCRRLGNQPISIMNFLEGTRFTEEKRERQNAPYRYLLRPKAGGIAFVLGAIGGTLNSMLDVTIVYEGSGHTLWDFVCGRVRRVIVDVRERPLPRELVDRDYHQDADFRDNVQAWVRDLWAEKDLLIGSIASDGEGRGERRETSL